VGTATGRSTAQSATASLDRQHALSGGGPRTLLSTSCRWSNVQSVVLDCTAPRADTLLNRAELDGEPAAGAASGEARAASGEARAASDQAAPAQEAHLQAAQWARVRELAHDPNFVIDDQARPAPGHEVDGRGTWKVLGGQVHHVASGARLKLSARDELVPQ